MHIWIRTDSKIGFGCIKIIKHILNMMINNLDMFNPRTTVLTVLRLLLIVKNNTLLIFLSMDKKIFQKQALMISILLNFQSEVWGFNKANQPYINVALRAILLSCSWRVYFSLQHFRMVMDNYDTESWHEQSWFNFINPANLWQICSGLIFLYH